MSRLSTDPTRHGRVGIAVRPVLYACLLAAVLGGAACGGKSKGAAAPGGKGGESSMNDGASGGEQGQPGQPGQPDPAQPGQPDSGQPGQPGEAPPEPAAPPIVPPNLDPDPNQARSTVNEHLRIARDALKAGSLDPDRAISQARAALAVDATSVDAVVILAHAYYHKRLYDTAEVILDMLFKEREKARSNAGVYYVYGLVYDKSNEPAKARASYEKAVELDPGHASALANLGVHQLNNKQYRNAVSTYEKLTRELNRNDAETWNALGSAYRGASAEYDPGSSDRDEYLRRAEAAFKKATTLNRSYGPAYYNLGLLYLDADPFPGDRGPMDALLRLQRAKSYFDEYKNMPGANASLYEERNKDVGKLIKREEKKRKKAEKPPEG